MEAPAPIITLTTDFGLSDTYVGVMKGVILGIAPDARLIDLTHDVSPQNILEASMRLEAVLDYFPDGTIHLVVVDPGVGSDRAALAVQTTKSVFIAPDNGVLTPSLIRQPALRVVKLGEAARPFFLRSISATFHGRDIFAPIAAHIASGVPLSALGPLSPHDALVTLALPEPKNESGPRGQRLAISVLYGDRFGNLITALTPEKYRSWKQAQGSEEDAAFDASIEVQAGSSRWQGIVPTFSAVEQGEPLAYWGSAGRLEIAVRNDSAARKLQLSPPEIIYLCLPRTIS